MKKLILVLSAMALAMSVNFSASASSSGWATQSGPLVQCQFSDGSQGYIPSQMCRFEGGTFTNNPGMQW